NKAYVSPYDKFLYEFDATHKKSASQLHEIKKHERIFKMRDDKDYKIDQSEIWEGF
ncbi:TPA: CBU_0585 family protein, partial [Legionella pneumophila]